MRVDVVGQPAFLRHLLAHDGRIGARVTERLNWMAVDLDFHVQHKVPTHRFGVFVHHLLILLLDNGLATLLVKVSLGLFVIRIFVKSLHHVTFEVEVSRLLHGICDAFLDGFFAPNQDGAVIRLTFELPGKTWIAMIELFEQVVFRLEKLNLLFCCRHNIAFEEEQKKRSYNGKHVAAKEGKVILPRE